MRALWSRIVNIGVTNELSEQDAKYIRLTNALAIIVGLWLLSLAPSLVFTLPSSKYLILSCTAFPLLWLLALYFNYKHWYDFAKLFFSYTAMICVTINSLQAGRESDNHLFLLLNSLIAFYIYPPRQMKYITAVSLSALALFIGVEVYLTNRGPVIEAPPEFFQLARIVTLVALCVLVFILTRYNYVTLHRAQDLLAAEHEKSEALLLNVLPASIARRLKASHAVIADRANEATILFADIVSFTSLSQSLPPEKLVSLLNQVFTEFDGIVARHNLEKIKTIGDAYMAAGGIPDPRSDHCESIALCGLDMLAAVRSGKFSELNNLKLRIGIHTGPVVAGVIGKSKFIYDLWGDSVNTASRMESHGAEDRIHVTEEVYLKLKDRFEFGEKREIQVKGKGAMQTYFLLAARA